MTDTVRVLAAILFNRAPDQLEDLGKFKMSFPCSYRLSSALDSQLAIAENLQGGGPKHWGRAMDYNMYDWHLQRIPRNATVGEIPRPGVFFALREVPATGKLPIEVPIETGLTAYKEFIASEDQVLSAFLSSTDAYFEPRRLRQDVFISYSAVDEAVAHELKRCLEEQDLTVFLSSDNIPAGAKWRDELHEAMRNSRVVLVILTRNSLTSQWVLFEISASKALGNPMLAACVDIDSSEASTVVSKKQCRSIQSILERDKFVQEIVGLCGS